MVVAHTPFCLSSKPQIEELYFSPTIDSVLNQYLVKGEQLIYLIEFKHRPKKLLSLLRELKHKNEGLIYDAKKNPEGKIKIVLTGQIPLKFLNEDDYHYIDIDGRLHKNYNELQKQNIYMYSMSYFAARNKYGALLYNRLKSIAESLSKKGLALRIYSTPNDEKIWIDMLDAGIQIMHVDELSHFKEVYEKWKIKNSRFPDLQE